MVHIAPYGVSQRFIPNVRRYGVFCHRPPYDPTGCIIRIALWSYPDSLVSLPDICPGEPNLRRAAHEPLLIRGMFSGVSPYGHTRHIGVEPLTFRAEHTPFLRISPWFPTQERTQRTPLFRYERTIYADPVSFSVFDHMRHPDRPYDPISFTRSIPAYG